MLLRRAHAAGGAGPQIGRQRAVARRHGDDDRTLGDADRGLDDRFGAETMVLSRLEPENIAGEMESADLPATVPQDLVSAYRAGDDLVEILRRLGFAIDLDIPFVAYRCAKQGERIGKRTMQRRFIHGGRMLEGRSGRSCGHGLIQHCPLL